jgi:quinol monooxygenase YgiN
MDKGAAMVSFTVRLKFDQEDHDAVAEMLRNLTLATRQEPGCVTYVAHFVDGDATTVLLYEQYRDQGAVDAHRASPHFHQYAIGGFFQLMKDRQMENLVAIC